MALSQPASGHISQESFSGKRQLKMKKESSSLGHMVLGNAGEGAAGFRMLGAQAPKRPWAPLLCLPCNFFPLCVVSFFPTTSGLLHGTGSVAAGCCRLQKSSLVAQEKKNLPSCSSQNHPGKHSDWPSWDHVLTSLIYWDQKSIPILRCCL